MRCSAHPVLILKKEPTAQVSDELSVLTKALKTQRNVCIDSKYHPTREKQRELPKEKHEYVEKPWKYRNFKFPSVLPENQSQDIIFARIKRIPKPNNDNKLLEEVCKIFGKPIPKPLEEEIHNSVDYFQKYENTDFEVKRYYSRSSEKNTNRLQRSLVNHNMPSSPPKPVRAVSFNLTVRKFVLQLKISLFYANS